MNGRLAAILQLIPRDGIGVIDVGTDHGMIPLALAKTGYPGRLLASDLREAPLQRAKQAASQEKAGERIQFILCDGLELCSPGAVDCIVIAGMGGDTICGILDRAEWVMNGGVRLVLQPMTHAEVLRYWLIHNGFLIDREEIVCEDGRIYQVFSASSSSGCAESLPDAGYLIGSLQLPRNRKQLKTLAEDELFRLQKKLDGLAEAGRRNLFYEGISDELHKIVNSL